MRLLVCTLTIVLAALPAIAAPLYNTPVFDPISGSYFELVDVHDRQEAADHMGYNWMQAAEDARRSTYKRLHGRLAIVPSLHVHEFLELTFRPNTYTWIGLRYMCKTRVLLDSEGRSANRATFHAWARFWRRDAAICEMNPNGAKWPTLFMSVAYTPVTEGFRWIGKGEYKAYDAYFVEYPTR